jgi:hypothetical protein
MQVEFCLGSLYLPKSRTWNWLSTNNCQFLVFLLKFSLPRTIGYRTCHIIKCPDGSNEARQDSAASHGSLAKPVADIITLMDRTSELTAYLVPTLEWPLFVFIPHNSSLVPLCNFMSSDKLDISLRLCHSFRFYFNVSNAFRTSLSFLRWMGIAQMMKKRTRVG